MLHSVAWARGENCLPRVEEALNPRVEEALNPRVEEALKSQKLPPRQQKSRGQEQEKAP
jgi:hypothetical protein